MRPVNIIVFLLVFSALAIASYGCVEKASETQIDTACQNLAKLSPGQGDDAEERLNKCKQDLVHEGISVEAAECRAKAKNTDVFWNKCR